MFKIKNVLLLLAVLLSGCTVVSANRVFPKLAFYWSKDAQLQRQSNADLARHHREYWLMEQLNLRDTQTLDLEVIGKTLVKNYGKNLAFNTVTNAWADQSRNAPLGNATNLTWLLLQPARVQDLAWMIQFQRQWLP